MNRHMHSVAALGTDSLVLAGAGHMGTALLRSWLSRGLPTEAVQVVEPGDPRPAIAAGIVPERIHTRVDPEWRPKILILAFKPQLAADACLPLQELLQPDTLVLSILAGMSINRLSGLLGGHGAIVRAMPNTPAAIGAGSTALSAPEKMGEALRQLAQDLMGCTGSTYWLEQENQMDAVTALSGSGPAYVYHLMECLAAAGEHVGLPKTLAQSLARETVIGAALLARESPEPPGTLRQQVTSPGGVTEAGLDVLMGPNGLAPLIRHTVDAAARRSKELGK